MKVFSQLQQTHTPAQVSRWRRRPRWFAGNNKEGSVCWRKECGSNSRFLINFTRLFLLFPFFLDEPITPFLADTGSRFSLRTHLLIRFFVTGIETMRCSFLDRGGAFNWSAPFMHQSGCYCVCRQKIVQLLKHLLQDLTFRSTLLSQLLFQCESSLSQILALIFDNNAAFHKAELSLFWQLPPFVPE